MKYDFHDVETISRVREAISELLITFDDIKTRLNDTPTKCMDSIFSQLVDEAIAYKKTSQYDLLKEYESTCAQSDYFSGFNLQFFELVKNPNRTIGDFLTIMKAINNVIAQLYYETEYISENYL